MFLEYNFIYVEKKNFLLEVFFIEKKNILFSKRNNNFAKEIFSFYIQYLFLLGARTSKKIFSE